MLILPALAMLRRVQYLQAAPWFGFLAAILMVGLAFLLRKDNRVNQAYRVGTAGEITIAQHGHQVAMFMNDLFSDRRPSVGVIRAGAVANTYDGEIIDLMGLNNTAMAHAPGKRKGIKNHASFKVDVFFSRRPEIILPHAFSGEVDSGSIQKRSVFDNRVLRGMLVDPRFSTAYDLVVISNGRAAITGNADVQSLKELSAGDLDVKPLVEPQLPSR